MGGYSEARMVDRIPPAATPLCMCVGTVRPDDGLQMFPSLMVQARLGKMVSVAQHRSEVMLFISKYILKTGFKGSVISAKI